MMCDFALDVVSAVVGLMVSSAIQFPPFKEVLMNASIVFVMRRLLQVRIPVEQLPNFGSCSTLWA